MFTPEARPQSPAEGAQQAAALGVAEAVEQHAVECEPIPPPSANP
jgi:hypothetical protein